MRREDLGNLRLLLVRGDPCSGLWLLLLLLLWLLSLDLLDSEDVDFLRAEDEALCRGLGLSLSLSVLGVLGFLSALEKSRI